MNEAAWKQLLKQICDGYVVPVIGPELLVDERGKALQKQIALRLLEDWNIPPDTVPLQPFRELNTAVPLLLRAGADLQQLYDDIDSALRAITAAPDFVMPSALAQLAAITDFRLFVTLTADDVLARCLAQRGAVNEIVHSPRLASSDFRDLGEWREQAGETSLLYLFGKSCSMPLFAIHDEDVLEYAHNVIARGSQVPTRFLSELMDRSLLLIGCNFPDWLSRFFLRLASKERLAVKAKREWLVESLPPDDPLAGFLRSYSRGTQVLSQVQPIPFVAELHGRWQALRAAPPQSPPPASARASLPPQALFFVSYSRTTDLPYAEALVRALQQLGIGSDEIWFDRLAIEPGQDFRHRILDGIRDCRYFLPLLSSAADARPEAFVFSEWREANDRLRRMNRAFLLPVVVDPDYAPERYTAEPTRAWTTLDYGHAPSGIPDQRLTGRLRTLVRDARRPANPLSGQ